VANASGVGSAAKNIVSLMGPESMNVIIQNGPGASECIAQYIAQHIAQYIAQFMAQYIVELMQTKRVLANTRPSILLDHYAGRPSDVDAINATAVDLSHQPCIPTPLNEILTAVIRQRRVRFRFAVITKRVT
jgi:ketopantoate reductase